MADIILTLPDEPKKPKRDYFPGPDGKPTDAQLEARWKPGQSGNPAGRPPGSGKKKISDAYTAKLEGFVPRDLLQKYGFVDLADDITWAELIADLTMRKLVERLASGDMDFLREVREVTEGKVKDKHEFSGPGDTPLPSAVPVLNIVFKDPPKKEDE